MSVPCMEAIAISLEASAALRYVLALKQCQLCRQHILSEEKKGWIFSLLG